MFLTTEQIQRAYVACFGRNADVGGFEYWKKQDFQNENQLYQFFVNSPEGQAIYGGKSNSEIVEIIYQNALGRPSDAPGKAYWQSGLDAQNYDVATLIQTITPAAIENNEKTQTLVDAAVKNTKIEQIELATVIALGRPATVKEINAGLDKDQSVYDYLQDISKTAEFQKNGKTLYEVLSTKVKDLSADDGNFNMSNLANLLIAAHENPQNDKQTAFSNQVLVSVATGNDMLENPENAASYEAKLAMPGGLKQVQNELATVNENLKPENISPEVITIETYDEPTPTPTPTPKPTPQPTPSPSPTPKPDPEPTPSPEPEPKPEPQPEPTPTPPENDPPAAKGNPVFTDTEKIGVLDKNDTITISFTEVIDTKISVSDLQVSNGHTLGTDAKIEAKDAQDNFAKDFVITLGEGADVVTGDKITIAKDKVVDNQDLAANSDVEFTLPELPKPESITLTVGDTPYTLKSNDKSVTVTYDDENQEYTLTTDSDSKAIASSDFKGTITSSDVSNFTMTSFTITSPSLISHSIDFSRNTNDTEISVTSEFNIFESTIKGGDGNDRISISTTRQIASAVLISGGKGVDAMNIDPGTDDSRHSFGSLKFDYSNAADFANNEVDTITGFAKSDKFVLPSGYSFSGYEPSTKEVKIIENSTNTEYVIATLVGYSDTINSGNFTTVSPT